MEDARPMEKRKLSKIRRELVLLVLSKRKSSLANVAAAHDRGGKGEATCPRWREIDKREEEEEEPKIQTYG